MDDLILSGITALKSNNRDWATKFFSQAVVADPKSDQAWYWLGYVSEDPERKVYCFQRSLTLNPNYANTWLELGRIQTDAQKKEYCYRRALALDPQNPAIWQALAPQAAAPATAVKTAQAASALNVIPSIKTVPEEKKVRHTRTPEEKAAQSKSSKSFWSMLGFGFLLGLVLVTLPGAFMVYTGKFDSYFQSLANEYNRKPMPSLIEHWQDTYTTATPLATPSTPLDERVAKAAALKQQAIPLLQIQNYIEAKPILDQILELVPDDDETLFNRADCLIALTNQSTNLDETIQNTYQAMRDIDAAIALKPEEGNYYLERGTILQTWGHLEERSVNRTYLLGLSNDNLEAAIALGSEHQANIEPMIIDNLVEMEAFDQAIPRAEAYLKNSTSLTLNKGEVMSHLARAYLSQDRFDDAKKMIAQAQQSDAPQVELATMQVYMTYLDGDYVTARGQVDEFMLSGKELSAEFFYVRSLILFSQGEWENTVTQLESAGDSTFVHGGLYSYIQGEMGLQLEGDDNHAKAINELQYAEASLHPPYHLIREKIQAQLKELNVATLEPTVSVGLMATPLPEFVAQPTARPSLTPTSRPTSTPSPTATTAAIFTSTPEASVEGTPTAETTSEASPTAENTIEPTTPAVSYHAPKDNNIIIVDMAKGSGPLQFSTNERKIFRIQPGQSIPYKKIMSIKLLLKKGDASGEAPMVLEFWDPVKSIWTSVTPSWGSNLAPYPNDHILPEGDIYIAIRNISSQSLPVDQLAVDLVYLNQNDEIESYGVE
jgi:tetratricopeptide (TPR) repeat protein